MVRKVSMLLIFITCAYLMCRATIVHRVSSSNCFQEQNPEAIHIALFIQKSGISIFRGDISEMFFGKQGQEK